MNDEDRNPDKYEVGQKVWWKSPKGVRFLFRVRQIHPSCADTYELEAVYADNCLDVPDNWANARDMRPLQLPEVAR